eukprot:3501858-Amphidinium_carterae.1
MDCTIAHYCSRAGFRTLKELAVHPESSSGNFMRRVDDVERRSRQSFPLSLLQLPLTRGNVRRSEPHFYQPCRPSESQN